MAHAAVDMAINSVGRREDLKPAEKWFFVILADHAGRDDWKFFHSHATLAKDAGISRRTVVTMLAHFEELGLITREERYRDDGSRSTDMISLTPGANSAHGPAAHGEGDAQKPARKRSKVAQHNLGSDPGSLTGATDVALLDEVEKERSEGDERTPVRIAFDAYNAFASLNGKSEAMKVTEARRRSLKARLHEVGGLQGWLAALDRVERSAFLMGRTHHQFMISLDFLLQPSSFTRLIEGYYDGERSNGSSPTAGGGDARNESRTSAIVAGALAAVDEIRRERRG